MSSAAGRFVIVLNGEVYNFQDLRAEEEGRGVRFRGHSDTEVMLAVIERRGLVEATKAFVGMYAFALFDRRERLLHLVRDRLGEKPLYHGWMGSSLLFGSELKALRAHPAWRGEIDRGALTLFLRHNYIPTPYSIYRGIAKLPAATIATYRADAPGREPELVPYWSARSVAEAGLADPLPGSEREVLDELDRVLRRTIRREMIADVPLGAFLSGGIDSSLVVALMQAESPRPVRTFTIGFHEPGYNEAEHAKAVARHLGTDHTELYVTPGEALEVVPKLPQMYDEPFSDSSQIPTHLVARMARQHVTVSLSGDGGDELFAGYWRYFMGSRLWRGLGPLPVAMRRVVARGIQAVSPGRWEGIFRLLSPVMPRSLRVSAPGDRMHKLAGVLAAGTAESLYRDLNSHWRQPTQVVIGGSEPPTALTDRGRWARLDGIVPRMMFLDLISYLPDDILVKVDRASMAVGLESRAPFLDHEVAEFAWRIPLAMKLRNGKGKWILRQLLGRYVPATLFERPKMGFGIPIDAWLRGPLREWAEALLDERRLRQEGFFDGAEVSRKWREHLDGSRNWQYLLWDVLMFQAWREDTGALVTPGLRSCGSRAPTGN